MEFQTHIISCVLNISTGMAHQPADSVCPTTELLSPTPVFPAAISGLLVSTRHRPSPPPLTQPVPCSVCESACQVLSLLSSPFLSAQGPSLHQNAIALSTDVLVPLVFSVACCSCPKPIAFFLSCSDAAVLMLRPSPDSNGSPPPAEGRSP